ncbi:MAG: SpoIIE family protein phosphatase [Phycisphaerales bacterium]|nr:SpoIIE family protein phosphatase [Phycisphaerales bacterium]
MADSDNMRPELKLLSTDGPTPIAFELAPPAAVTIGRSAQQTLVLDDPSVSRAHARITFAPGGEGEFHPLLADAGSTHGTYLNGLRLTGTQAVPLHPGDRITIGPWTLRLIAEGLAPDQPATIATSDDLGSTDTIITRLDAQAADRLAGEKLTLLLNCAAAIHAADDPQALADAVLQASLSGTGFSNGAFLRPGTTPDAFEVLACRGPAFTGPAAVHVSRSLLREAAGGTPAALTAQTRITSQAQSIMELGLTDALCAPVLVGSEVAAYLYLDNRSIAGTPRRVREDATGFALGLARMAGLAMSNLQRLDIERRHARMEAELTSAAAVQQLMLPRREGRFARISYLGESRAGRYLGGDFFDVVPLDDHRLAFALGDVAGKGVAAAVLVTTAQGYLHAALQRHDDPGRAVSELNRFFHVRCPPSKFITLWVGVFDVAAGTLDYVDAGHGHAVLMNAAGQCTMLVGQHDGPVGILPDSSFESLHRTLDDGDKVFVFSDGIVEAFGHAAEQDMLDGFAPPPAEETKDFGSGILLRFLPTLPAGADDVAALFAAVDRPADPPLINDDATALVVRW